MAAFPTPAAAQQVTLIEPGVHRLGQEDAPLTITEYISYTCPHCAHFESQAGDVLRVAYAATGKASIIIRHQLRDQYDLTAALLANCGDADRFPGNHSAIMHAQGEWLGALQATTQAQRNRYASGALGARLQAVARDSGLYALMVKRGYGRTELDKCLADEAFARELSDKTASYAAEGVRSTPSFKIGDMLLAGTHDWATLKPQIDVRLP